MKKMILMTLAMTVAVVSASACAKSATGVHPSVSQGANSTAEQRYVALSEDLGAEEYGIGFRKADIALGLEIQRLLEEMTADGTAVEISNKWFGTDVLLRDKPFLKESEAPAGDASLEKIKAKGELIVGLDDSYPPMGFRDDQNNIVGFDIDLATEAAKRMGVAVKFQPIDWDAKEMELESGKIDCIWNGMTITDERIERMFFSKAYIANQQIIVVSDSSGITQKSQLEGKIVGLQKGSSSLEALTADPVNDKVKEIVQYPDNVSAFLDLKAGRIDVFVVDSVVGRYIISQQEN